VPAETLTTYVTAEEYLERERAAWNSKSEWIDGEVRVMTGAKLAHNTICFTLAGLLFPQLKGRPFLGCPGDMKVRIPDGPYYYPDLVIAPDPPEFEDGREDIVLNPVVVVEVLSPSTEEFDRGRKLDDYRRLPSLRDYLLVDQFEARIDHYVRSGEVWDLAIVTDLAGVVRLPAIGCELPLAEVYDRILPPREG
jgi:Uma2 family endonuclease